MLTSRRVIAGLAVSTVPSSSCVASASRHPSCSSIISTATGGALLRATRPLAMPAMLPGRHHPSASAAGWHHTTSSTMRFESTSNNNISISSEGVPATSRKTIKKGADDAVPAPMVVGDTSRGVVDAGDSSCVMTELAAPMGWDAFAGRPAAGDLLFMMDACAARTAMFHATGKRSLAGAVPASAPSTGSTKGGIKSTTTIPAANSRGGGGRQFSVVTIAVDNTTFRHPVLAGDMLQFKGTVIHAGRSSIGVHMQVLRLQFPSKKPQLVCESFFSMVAIDEHLQKANIVPAVRLVDRRQERLRKKELRRQEQQQSLKQHQDQNVSTGKSGKGFPFSSSASGRPPMLRVEPDASALDLVALHYAYRRIMALNKLTPFERLERLQMKHEARLQRLQNDLQQQQQIGGIPLASSTPISTLPTPSTKQPKGTTANLALERLAELQAYAACFCDLIGVVDPADPYRNVETDVNRHKRTHVTMHETRTEANRLFFPSSLNFNQTIYGGELMRWMEAHALQCARMFTQNKYVVSLSMHNVAFSNPVHLSDWVSLAAHVVFVHHTTCEVDVEIFVERGGDDDCGNGEGANEDQKSGSVRKRTPARVTTNRASFVIMSMDEIGQPKEIQSGLFLPPPPPPSNGVSTLDVDHHDTEQEDEDDDPSDSHGPLWCLERNAEAKCRYVIGRLERERADQLRRRQRSTRHPQE